MAVIKVFSPSGVKTVQMLGNVSEQDYDPIEADENLSASEDTEAEE